jgi:hypothetical protein
MGVLAYFGWLSKSKKTHPLKPKFNRTKMTEQNDAAQGMAELFQWTITTYCFTRMLQELGYPVNIQNAFWWGSYGVGFTLGIIKQYVLSFK